MIQTLIDSFHFFKNNLDKISILILAFVGLANISELAVSNILPPSMPEETSTLVQLLLGFVLNAIFQCTFIMMLVSINKHQQVALLQCLRDATPFVVIYILGSILVNSIIFVGLLFLILPGAYLYARFAFFDFELIINSRTPFGAINASWKRTSGKALRILLTILPLIVIILILVWLFNLIGELNFVTNIIGNIIFWTLGAFIVVVRYRLYILFSADKPQNKSRKKSANRPYKRS